LDKYYLNIKKVRPIYLKDEIDDHPQKIINISEIKEYSLHKNNELGENGRLKGTHIRANSKR
jgi:hypothetical protein